MLGLLGAPAVLGGLAALGGAPSAWAQDADHGGHSRIQLEALETAQRQRARRIFAEIVCKCPNENWSKSLLNCPDGCADPQKQEILQQILEGWDDERIVAQQIRAYGPRAHGKPDDLLTYALPWLVLAGAATIVVVVFRRWGRSSAAAHAVHAAGPPPADDELAAVERELQELR